MSIKLATIKLPKLPTRQQIKRAMPTILAAISVVGNCASTYLYVERTINATREADAMTDDGYTKKEIVKKVAPRFILPTVIFVGAQICTIECNVLNRRQQLGLTAALAGIDYRYKRFKEKTKEHVGEEEFKKIEEKAALDDFRDYCELVGNQNDGSPRYIAPEGEVLFYDEYRTEGNNDGYFTSTMIQVKQAMYHLNRNFVMRGYASLNELYEFIGIPLTNYGEYAGWDMCDLEVCWIDFEIREIYLADNMVAYAIDYVYAPQVPQEAIEEGLV